MDLCYHPNDTQKIPNICDQHTLFYRCIEKTNRITKKFFFQIPEGDHMHEKIHFFSNMKMCYEKSSTLIGLLI